MEALPATIQYRHPIAFLFFGAAVAATYYAGGDPALRHLAQAAFLMFLALGPVLWFEMVLYSMPMVLMPIGSNGVRPHMRDSGKWASRIGFVAVLLQLGLLGGAGWRGWTALDLPLPT